MVQPRSDGLWAITSYFNPVGYARRFENYRLFRNSLKVPLVTVELSFDGRFQLGPADAEVLVQLCGSDIMWQKERLLNIALRRVPAPCRIIAWLDCDIVFATEDWAERASAALDRCLLLHLFKERHDLRGPAEFDDLRSWCTPPTSMSVVYKRSIGETVPEDYSCSDAPLQRRSTAGLAWASRREVLEKHGLYDACILGGGDRAVLAAALGEFGYGVRATGMNAQREAHYLAWARPYFETVQGRIGHVPATVFHLWHGELKDRQYQARHRWLAMHDFDPATDIALDRSGCWRWNSDKGELHELVRQYFESRREDANG